MKGCVQNILTNFISYKTIESEVAIELNVSASLCQCMLTDLMRNGMVTHKLHHSLIFIHTDTTTQNDAYTYSIKAWSAVIAGSEIFPGPPTNL